MFFTQRIKKSLGPDFVETSPCDLGLQYFQEAAYEPKCDFCQLNSSCNPKGQPEDLLICKDCNAKGKDIIFVYVSTFS